MEVFRGIESVQSLVASGSAVTIGNYDGIHRGHQRLIEALLEEAAGRRLKSVLLTFEPHPQRVLAPDRAPEVLTTLEEKLRLLQQFSALDAVVVLDFTPELATVQASNFLERYLLGDLRCQSLVIGYNHAFGYRREGDLEFLKRNRRKFGYGLVALEPVLIADEPVHSNRIRDDLKQARLDSALELLGHEFELSGRVVRGRGIGRELGYPTINIRLPEEKLVPPPGVYAAHVIFDGAKRAGMMYIGESKQEFDLEVNLFDFAEEAYGRPVSVFPAKFVRPSLRFAHSDDLIAQIRKDERIIRRFYNLV